MTHRRRIDSASKWHIPYSSHLNPTASMRTSRKHTKKNGYNDSCFLSRAFMTWIFPLLKLGYQTELSAEDVYECCNDDDPQYWSEQLEREWMKEVNTAKKDAKGRSTASITSAVIGTFGKAFLAVSPLVFFVDAFIRMLQPLLIGLVVRYLSHAADVSYGTVQYCAAGIIASSVLMIFMGHHGTVLHNRQGCNLRAALTHLIYKKVLRLSMSSIELTEIGQILNILATDLSRLDDLGWLLTYLAAAPIASILAFVTVYKYLGNSSISGFMILLLFIPFQACMGKLFAAFRRKTTGITDQRISLMSEIVSAMKLIKMYCWEYPFSHKIHDIREHEIHAMRKTYVLEGVNAATYFVSVKVILFACFLTHVYCGQSLDPEAVFVTMAIVNAVRIPVSQYFPLAISQVGESSVTMSRINAILLLEEKADTREEVKHKQRRALHPGRRRDNEIRLQSYTAKWTRSLKTTNLTDISMIVKEGELLLVIGSVGAGKSCLLHAILHELHHVSGFCTVEGRISYAAQESWCFGGNIRQNILLANPYNEARYKEVIRVCGLERDLSLFDEADETFVGEKGHNLSGGQRARVSLARAVYHEADIYLLDDPLSAVDPHVANHIFDKCISNFLHNKMVILVTHQLQFLERADQIAVLKDGRMMSHGNYRDLMRNPECASFVEKRRREAREKSSTASTKRSMSIIPDEEIDWISEAKERMRSVRRSRSASVSNVVGLDILQDIEMMRSQEKVKQSGPFSSSSPSSSAPSSSCKILWTYLKAGSSNCVLILTILVSIASQVLYQFIDLWLSAWTAKDYQSIVISSGSNLTQSSVRSKSLASAAVFASENVNIIMYTCIVASLFVIAFLRMLLSYTFCLKCSMKIHSSIFAKLLRSKMSFFESNPIGKILNRFTRDMGIIDMHLPRSLVECNTYATDVVGIVVTAILINYYVLYPTTLVVLICLPMRYFFIPTIRALYRMDSVARSPVYHHMSTTFDGIITLRAFKLEHEFEQQNIIFLSDATACRFLYSYVDRAFGFYLELLALLYICIMFVILFQTPAGSIAGGDAGLILSQSLLLIGVFQYLIRITNDLENQMVSADRVLEYGRIESEAELHIPGKVKDEGWPSKGSIVFRDVSLRYSSEADPVLKNISFEIQAGQTVGIVGRTGAGKSSLISALFRLIEVEGKILIDGVDTQSLGLHELRHKISIIPQDPSLFSGSVRSNLDPFQEYTDDVMWIALTESHLRPLVTEMGGLDAVIAEGGSNLSLGQRQLLCMARALLKRNRILVLDEATASVDQGTDEIIQRTIKETFKGQTVLTVAHRLNTIIEMDKVLVMDAGRVIEFDEPYMLLKNRHGLFHSMVRQTGTHLEKILHSLACMSHAIRKEKSEAPGEAK